VVSTLIVAHPLTAAYNASAAFAASASRVVIQVVNANAADAVTITVLSTDATGASCVSNAPTARSRVTALPPASTRAHELSSPRPRSVLSTGTWRFRGNVNLTVTTV